jgi:hypothetical protein
MKTKINSDIIKRIEEFLKRKTEMNNKTDLLKTFDKNPLTLDYKIFEFRDKNNNIWYKLKKKNIFGVYFWIRGGFLDSEYGGETVRYSFFPIEFSDKQACLRYIKRKNNYFNSKKLTIKEVDFLFEGERTQS